MKRQRWNWTTKVEKGVLKEQNKWLQIEKTALKGFLLLSEIDLEIGNWQLCKKHFIMQVAYTSAF